MNDSYFDKIQYLKELKNSYLDTKNKLSELNKKYNDHLDDIKTNNNDDTDEKINEKLIHDLRVKLRNNSMLINTIIFFIVILFKIPPLYYLIIAIIERVIIEVIDHKIQHGKYVETIKIDKTDYNKMYDELCDTRTLIHNLEKEISDIIREIDQNKDDYFAYLDEYNKIVLEYQEYINMNSLNEEKAKILAVKE